MSYTLIIKTLRSQRVILMNSINILFLFLGTWASPVDTQALLNIKEFNTLLILDVKNIIYVVLHLFMVKFFDVGEWVCMILIPILYICWRMQQAESKSFEHFLRGTNLGLKLPSIMNSNSLISKMVFEGSHIWRDLSNKLRN